MSSIGTGYDLVASTFSPDGRIFQVEYAQKAVDSGGTVISLSSKHGVVTAVEKHVVSSLYVENANPRVENVNEYIGCTSAGVYPDCCALLDYADGEALKYLKENREPIPVKKLAESLAEFVHIFTLGIHRPWGGSLFFTSWDRYKGPKIYLVEPSGLCYEYESWAVGKHRQAAKTEIEKLKAHDLEPAKRLENLSLKQMVYEAVRILLTVRDESKEKNLCIEMGWVGDTTNGKFEPVPKGLVKEAEEKAQKLLEEEDADD